MSIIHENTNLMIIFQSSYLRNLKEPQQIRHLNGGDGRGGAHHARNHLSNVSFVAAVLAAVDVAD